MTDGHISKADFLAGGRYAEVIGCWTKESEFFPEIKKEIFNEEKIDYYTPLEKGKEWLFELTIKEQPRMGSLLMDGGDLFVRVRKSDGASRFVLDLGLEVRKKVVLVERSYWNSNPSDPEYQLRIDQFDAALTKRDGRPRKSEQRYLSLPLPIREAYYNRFDGLNIPKGAVVGASSRILPFPIWRPWQSWDHYLEGFRGYKKKYISWLEERIPGMKMTPDAWSYTSFMMFMAAGPNPAGKEGDVFFVKNNIQDGVIYHVKDADIENMRILSEPAEAIDRYCEHILLERDGRFDFLPYTSPM